MALRITPVYNGNELRVREAEVCEPCANAERMVLLRPGVRVGQPIECPACTLRGARNLRALVRRGGEA